MQRQPKNKTRVHPVSPRGAMARRDRREELDRRRARRRGKPPAKSPERVSQLLAETGDDFVMGTYRGLQSTQGPNRATRRGNPHGRWSHGNRWATGRRNAATGHRRQQNMVAARNRRLCEGRKTEAWRDVLDRHAEMCDALRDALRDKLNQELQTAAKALYIPGHEELGKTELIEAIVRARLPHPARRV